MMLTSLNSLRSPAEFFLDEDGVVRLLRAKVERAGSQTVFAKKHQLSRTNLNKILTGALPPTKSVIKALRLRRVYIPE